MQAKSPWSLRPVEPQDLAFLRKMLWEAAYWRDASTCTPVAGDLETPDLAYLLATCDAEARIRGGSVICPARPGGGHRLRWRRTSR